MNGKIMAEAKPAFNFCPGCGAQNPASNKFCSRCGTSLQRKIVRREDGEKCEVCGHLNPAGSKFCIQCSSSLSRDIVVRDEGEIAVIKVNSAKIDFENHKDLLPVFNKVMKKMIVLDLENVEWMDSTGIGALVTLTYKSSRTNQEIKLINIQSKVMDAIRALQVDNVLDIHETMNEARVSWGLPLI
ncbi:MAG: zinc ribbon domain-containing protein [bacterium]